MKIFFCLILILYSLNIYAKSWKVDSNTGCYIWALDDAVIKWFGPCVKNKAHGNGVLSLYTDDGVIFARYEGEVKDGKQNGKGIFYDMQDNSRYEGEWKDGQMDGVIIFTDASGGKVELLYRMGEPLSKAQLNIEAEKKRAEEIHNMKLEAIITEAKEMAECMRTPKCRAKIELKELQGKRELYKQKEQAQVDKAQECSHVYIGKEFRARYLYGLATREYSVVGFSTAIAKATVVDSDGHKQEIGCNQIPD